MGTMRRRPIRSRGGGVPTTLADVAPSTDQLALPLGDAPAERVRRDVMPGVVHVAGWLDAVGQRRLAQQFRVWAEPPAGLRHPRMPTGHLMRVQSVCLGWHWYPYTYSRTADDTDGAPVKPLPDDLAELSRAAVRETFGMGFGTAFAPDAAIVNLYSPGAHLGLHQDGEEPSDAPVVTLSLGDTGTFRLAGVERRTGPFVDVELSSGDLLVFGGVSRRIYHGVPRVAAGTGPSGLGLPPGRLSITVRETGLVSAEVVSRRRR